MIFSNISQFFKQNKKIFCYIVLFLALFWVSGDFAFARGAGDDTDGQDFVDIINWLMQWIWVWLALFTYLATVFLSPEWYNGNFFGMTDEFNKIWILVSNVVYFVFALILIWIAFMNIIWKNADQYQLKQALPKFIVWVLIVPFSWFLVQFILSIAAVLTVSSLTLPFDTFKEYGTNMKNISLPSKCYLDLTTFGNSSDSAAKKDTATETQTQTTGTKTTSSTSSDDYIRCDKINSSTAAADSNSISSIFGIVSLYTYGILSFDSIDNITRSQINNWNIKTFWDLVVKIWFDFIFVIVYWILFITLWMVLLIRWVYIWIYTMMSPVFWLMYFFDKKDWAWEGFFSKFNVKEFISLALVPVYVMLALSFGLLFIYVIGQWMTSVESGWDGNVVIDGKNNIITLGNNFSLEIKWNMSNLSADDVTGFLDTIEEGWTGALWVIGTLILKVFGIIVLRWAIMAAMRTSEITKTITQPIYDFGSKVWGIVASAPGNMPVFWWKSATELSSAAWAVKTSIDSHYTSRWTEWWNEVSPFAKTSASWMNSVNARHTWVNSKAQWEEYINEMREHVRDLTSTLRNDSSRKQFLEMIKKIFWEDMYEAVKAARNEVDFHREFKAAGDAWKITTSYGQNIYNDQLRSKDAEWLARYFENTWENNRSDSQYNRPNEDFYSTWDIENWRMKIEINWRNMWRIPVNEDGFPTEINDNIVNEIRDLIINEGKRKDDINEIIRWIWFTDEAATQLRDGILSSLYYNETTRDYWRQEAEWYERVNSYDDIN